MRYLGLSLFLSLMLTLVGCSAIVSPDETLLGGDGGGTGDTGVGEDTGIVLMDGGPDGGPADTGGPPDTSLPDAVVVDVPPTCVGDDYCEGDVAVQCVDGMTSTIDCPSMGAFCRDGECQDWECTPGASRCDGDGRVATCDDRGTGETRMDCEHGCDPDTSACRPAPMICPGIPPLALGASVMVNTCGQGDDTTHQPTGDAGGCPATSRANGGDLMYAITLTTRQTITLDLRDDDGRAAIDTIVYLRTDCEDRGSQIACSDDLPCDETIFGCSGGGTRPEVRQSRITVTLDPGTYYVAIDTFNYRTGSGLTFTCGNVVLRFLAGAISATP